MKSFQRLKLSGLFLPILMVTQFGFADVSDDLKKAEKFLNANQYTQAEQIYLNVINQADPNKPEEFKSAFNSHKKLPLVYLAMGQQSQAQAAVQQLLTRHADYEWLPHAVHEIIEQAKEANKMLEAGQIYQNILTAQPKHPQAIWLKMGIAITNVHFNNDQTVDSTLQNIIAEHVTDVRAAEAFGHIAWAYRKLKQYDKTLDIYQYVVDNWSDKDRAIFCQYGIIVCNQKLNDQKAADAATEQLLQKYAGDKNMAEVIWYLASDYKKERDWVRTRPLCEYILKNHIDDEENALMAQEALILASIDQKDATGVRAGLENLFAKFSSDKKIPSITYWIAQKLNHYDDATAQQLYQYIIDKHPDHKVALKANIRMGQIHVRRGEDSLAESIYQKVLSDYANDPNLPQVVHLMAEGYFDQAMALEKEQADQIGSAEYARLKREQKYPKRVKDYYNKAIEKWEIIRQDLTPAPHHAAQAEYFIGVCYRRHLGDPEKALEYYQKVVEEWPDYKYAWSAQSMIGLCYETLKKSGKIPESQADPKIEKAYKAVVEKHSDCSLAGQAIMKLGRLNFEKGQWDDAASYYGLFLEKYPNAKQWRSALLSLGFTYERKGQPQVAAELYRSYLGISDPDDSRLKMLRARFERLEEMKK